MANTQEARTLALSLPEAVEGSHFQKVAFKVNKKIFATLDTAKGILCIKLTPQEQDLFCVYDRNVIWPVPNKWGLQGWTNVDLQKIPNEMLKDAIVAAYCTVAPSKFAQQLTNDR